MLKDKSTSLLAKHIPFCFVDKPRIVVRFQPTRVALVVVLLTVDVEVHLLSACWLLESRVS